MTSTLPRPQPVAPPAPAAPEHADRDLTGHEHGWREARDDRLRELLQELATESCPENRQRLREEIVECALPMARAVARRYGGRGESLDDLTQVAAVGLMKALNNFDVERDNDFAVYALPTMLGELKRHFRDRGWMVRPPRRLQELHREISAARDELGQQLGRSPRVSELAAHLGVGEEEITEALIAGRAYSTTSLDAPTAGEDDGGVVADRFGEDDRSLFLVECRAALAPLIKALPARERHILALRFSRGLTQSQIAAEIGISQMHVSRLLARTLEQLRQALEEG